MNLSTLWKKKQYSEIYRLINGKMPKDFTEEERIICAEVFLKNGRTTDALAFFREADEMRMTEEQLVHYAQLLRQKKQDGAAYELLLGRELQSFEGLQLFYYLKKQKNCPKEELLELLSEILEISYQEDLLFDQAVLYYQSGQNGRGRRACRQLISFFGSGSWVERAQELMDDPESMLAKLEAEYAEQKAKEAEANKVRPISGIVANPRMTEAAQPVEKPKEEYPKIIEEAFEGLIGMDSVKKELTGFYNMIRLQNARKEMLGIDDRGVRAYNFVLYGNPGTGKTTVARIIAKVLYALGIRESDKFAETDRGKLVGQYIGETAQKTKKVIESARGGTLFIDEAYSLMAKGDNKDFGKEAVDTLLKDMEDHRDAYSVIMAGYKEPMNEMLKLNAGFQSRFNYHITIPDYTDDELLEIARRNAKSKHYTISTSGEQAIRKCIVKERIDETFGNARFIRELINKAEIQLANRLSKAANIRPEEMSILTGEDFLPGEKEELPVEALLEELNQLTGLASVKQMVNNLLATIQVKKEAERRGISLSNGFGTLHMAFRGNPGTGKTTVARIMGRILGQMGVLKRGDVFVECSRAEVVGQYQGHTAGKVKDVVASAMGGILFVDEAYSLVKTSDDSFGLEAVDTLIAEMENHKSDLIVILAGYSNELDEFLATNAGFASRINLSLTFEDYSTQELTEIFFGMAKKQHLYVGEELRRPVEQLLEAASKQQNFGNARGVRNVFETACRFKDARVAQRLLSGQQVEDLDLVTITIEDIEKAGGNIGR